MFGLIVALSLSRPSRSTPVVPPPSFPMYVISHAGVQVDSDCPGGGAAHPSAWTTVSANCGDEVSMSGCPLYIFLHVMDSPSSSSSSHPRHR